MLALKEPDSAEAQAQHYTGYTVAENGVHYTNVLEDTSSADAKQDCARYQEADIIAGLAAEVGIHKYAADQQKHHLAKAGEETESIEQEEQATAYQRERKNGAVAVPLVCRCPVRIGGLLYLPV